MTQQKKSKKTPSLKETPSIKSTPDVKPVKKTGYRYFDEYKDFFTHRKIPVSHAFIDKLAEDLINWANNDESAIIAEKFWYLKGIAPNLAQVWRKKHPALKAAYEIAKKRIGIRREEGSLLKKFDNATFFRTALNYSPEFVATTEWQAKLKQEQDEITQRNNINWTLEKFQDSKLVPEKPKEDEEK